MYYCFLAEDIAGLVNDPLVIQKNYAERLGSLCIGYWEQQTILNSIGNPIVLTGQKVLLRCSRDNLSFGIRLLLDHGADLIETQSDVNQIENWYKLGITRRKIYELSLANLMNKLPRELCTVDKIFIKTKNKGFSAVINPLKIIQRDSELIDFLAAQEVKFGQNLLLSKYIQMRADSLGTRETRHVILNNQLVNSSRLLHSLKHSVPKSHKKRAQEITSQIEKLGMFPSNYILDLGEMMDDDCLYLDIVELNPISCSMCFVNNSIFDIAVPEISVSQSQLEIGFEYCYNYLSSPQNYELTRISNKSYAYTSEERYFFL